MAGEIELHDGRTYTIKVNGKVAEYLFDSSDSETFDITEAVEWVDMNDGSGYKITPEDRIEIKLWGIE